MEIKWRKILRKLRNVKALRVDDGRKRVPCGDVTGTAEARVLSGLDPLCLWFFMAFIDDRQNIGRPVTLVRL